MAGELEWFWEMPAVLMLSLKVKGNMDSGMFLNQKGR
jgi:hypothetical protein